ncbi:MAG: hypothetical protein ABI549_13020 [Flavobacterium sp.]|uniref:hypothetical protein n=1 Tax=Flavobacterium sp. TaxID=239 RepID=UPI0032670281
MRIVAFFISIFFLMIGGKDYSYAFNHNHRVGYSSNKTFASKLKSELIIEDLSITVIDDNDSDLDEEYLSHDDVKENCGNKLFFEKSKVQNTWFLLKSLSNTLNSCNNRFKIFSHFCGYSYPIYISQRVLRI